MESVSLPKPAWIRARMPAGDGWKQVDGVLGRLRLHTVCDEARCPNKGECWGAGTAAFMVMGDVCTRSCRFCAVNSAKTGRPLDAEEPARLAQAAAELGLRYVVITSVDRDDLADRGAAHFAACVGTLKAENAALKVEALIPDYTEAELAPVLEAGPDVIAHNVETVRSLQHVRDRRAGFDKSLATLKAAKQGISGGFAPLTKSSLILGMGETPEEVSAAMDELREAGVDILVMGQYLQPSRLQIPVAAYITPEDFDRYGAEARSRGFASVVSAPLARTSYHAFDAAAALTGPRVDRIEAAAKPAGCKLIRVSAEISGGVIRSIKIRGDFFASPGEAFDRLEARLPGTPLADLAAVFDRLLPEEGVEAQGISGAGLREVIASAFA